MIATAEPETNRELQPGRAASGRFLDGFKFAKGDPLRGKIEKFRAMLLKTSEERFPEVIEKLYELAIEGERWAVEIVLDRCLGKVPAESTGAGIAAPRL